MIKTCDDSPSRVSVDHGGAQNDGECGTGEFSQKDYCLVGVKLPSVRKQGSWAWPPILCPRTVLFDDLVALPTLESWNASRENPCQKTIRAHFLHFSDTEFLHLLRGVYVGRSERPV